MSKELSFIRSFTSYGLHGIFCKIRTLRLVHFMYWFSFCWEKTQRRTMQLIWNKIEHWSYFLLMNKLIYFFFSPFCFIAKCSIISCCNVDIIINEKKKSVFRVQMFMCRMFEPVMRRRHRNSDTGSLFTGIKLQCRKFSLENKKICKTYQDFSLNVK